MCAHHVGQQRAVARRLFGNIKFHELFLDHKTSSLYANAMKASILYHPQSEFARGVEEYVHDFKTRTGQEIELISLETKEGANAASLYDIVRYPALLVCQDNGDMVKFWEGEQLPLMNEVAGYLN